MRPRLLDLFCGAGGAAVGYHRAGFDVVGVDVKPQPNYPFELVQTDAIALLEDPFRAKLLIGKPDAIHASPLWFRFAKMGNHAREAHADDVTPVRDLLRATGLPYVCESGTNGPLTNTVMFCGAAAGIEVVRHMFFETNWLLLVPPCAHEPGGTTTGRYAAYGAHSVTRLKQGRKLPPRRKASEWRTAAELDWMTTKEASLAVPPAYTELIGHQLLAHLKATAAA